MLGGVYANTAPRSYPLSAYPLMIVPTTTDPVFPTSNGASLGVLVSHLLCAGQSGASALGNAVLPINLAAVGLSVLAVIPGAQAANTAIADCRNPNFLPGDTLTDNQLLRRAPMPAVGDGNSGEKCVTGTHPPTAEAFGLRAITIPALDDPLESLLAR
jgi:phosphate transport system substrate-binding protein